WNPVVLSRVPEHLIKAIIIAEDGRFYWHNGFDFEAIRDAIHYNWSQRKLSYGASTISQQTTKNLFLTPSRNVLRKWHELILTIALEAYLEKERILEIYLNIAQFGLGVYGVDAAARFYWGIPVSAITISQAAELAATLPSPLVSNPAKRTTFFMRKKDKIEGRLISVLNN
ncbi:MAG: monofunctional biosynthetic peptidoglycan transglycosylase, partial [Gammaproteobacteria bacterium]|nr:monofunctional biosynthetic peptidoglycan transglycosylase [Gammaproteobacteria bacterium]